MGLWHPHEVNLPRKTVCPSLMMDEGVYGGVSMGGWLLQ